MKIYDIKDPISTNGIDEGIHLLQAKMVREGYTYYDDLNGDQAPLAILTFSLFNGDVMSCRYLSIFLFFVTLLMVFFIAKRMGGRKAAMIAVVILSLDFTIHRESRLASLDLFSASFLCISSLFFIQYLEDERLLNLSLGSFFLSFSLLSKIIPVFFAVFLSVFMIWKSWKSKKLAHILIYFLFLLIPLALVFPFFSFDQLLEGVLLSQMHRGMNWYSKLSIFLFIGPSFIYFSTIKKWDVKDEKNLYLILWILLLFIPIMVQGKTFQHHFAYVVYPLSILTACVLTDGKKRKKIAFMAFVLLNISFISLLSFTSPHDLSYDVSKEIEEITQTDDVIISGNPLINVVSNRIAPPNITNLATYHYPPTEAYDVIYWLEKNETKAIVLYYYLEDMRNVKNYLENSSQWNFYKKIEGKGQILFNGFIPKFSEDVYSIYIKQ